ncbi:unnamed protein product [Acanthoscelides obtectus]|uniref:Uncharacterized protein n=1 Tax=Acanthoscelides obtectus TaxID=200917 RepID=A0A9P0QBD6_ACAOB|nr:unnamed protein product [Acanthoscelides obtectus]CAK1640288.1 hypothetical protein AOBTE_LOCUS11639 [Acanthoscelides obtectus]
MQILMMDCFKSSAIGINLKEGKNSKERLEIIDTQPSCSYNTLTKDNPLRETASTYGGMPCAASKTSLKRKRHSPVYVKRNDILLEIKKLLKVFYEKKDQRAQEKLEIERRKLADGDDIFKQNDFSKDPSQ